MTTATDCSLPELLEQIEIDEKRLETARNRQVAATGIGEADYLPLLFNKPVPFAYVEADMMEVFNSDEDMLRRELSGVISNISSNSDVVPCIRPNLGTGFLPTLTGLNQRHFTDKMPWLVEHHTPEKIAELNLDEIDLPKAGEMERCLRYIEYAKDLLPSTVNIFLADTQGPCDVAHLLVGDEYFYLANDDPDLMHAVMSKATELYIRGTKIMKEAIGQPMNRCPHSGTHYFEDIGVRICEDTTTLLGPKLLEEFVIPYTRKAAAACGNAWVHYCGDNKHLYKLIVEQAPEVKGLNFGNPERHDPEKVLPDLLAQGKFYVGTFPREKDESLEAYLTRMLAPVKEARRGLILQPQLRGEEKHRPEEVMALWHRLQD